MPETKRKYDPVKRKEYYERTKKLKGRNPSNTQDRFRTGERAFGAGTKARSEVRQQNKERITR